MKKVLLSLLMAVVCLPIAFGQAADRPFVTTSQIACGEYVWPVDSMTYTHDTTVMVITDSAIYVLDLTIRTASGDTTQIVDTANCVYYWNDSIWKTAGEHIGVIPGQNGHCDSIVRIMLTLTGVDSSNIDTTVCDRFNAPWGEFLTESVAFDSTYTTTEGCQRHDVVNIKIGHSFSAYEEYDYDGCNYRWHGYNITDTTARQFKFKTKVGKCDSVYTVKVNLSFRILNEHNITNCGPYTFHGQSLATSGTYVDRDTVGKCVTIDSLILVVNPVYYNTNPEVRDVTAGCFYKWGDQTYTDLNTVHTDTVLSVNGCDSIGSIRIIAYTNEEYDTTVTSYCGTAYSWANRQVTVEGSYDTTIFTTANNITCTTYYHLDLNFIHLHDTLEPVTRCATYTFTFPGQRSGQGYGANDVATFTESGLYTTDTTYNDPLFPDSNLYVKNPNTGCITFLALPLTIVEPQQRYRNGTTVVTACDKYTFKVDGATSPEFTTDTTGYVLKYENHSTLYSDPNRCYDSIGVLDLTIHHSTNIDTLVTTCDSFYWAFADTTLYHTEDFRKVMSDTVNEEGCPFYGHLQLTLHFTPVVAIEGDWMLQPGQSTTLRAVTNTQNVNFHWYKDNQEFGTDTCVTVNDPGNGQNVNIHLVTQVNTQNCPADNWLTVTFTNVGIDEVEGIDVNIYPNPANRIVNINCGEAISQVVIYNAIGQQVLVNNNSGNTVQLDLGNLAGGAYTMRIATADGNYATRKLIVSK